MWTGGYNAGAQQGLMTKLQQIIASNRLEAFYPPQKLQQLVDRLQRIDFRYTPSSLLTMHAAVGHEHSKSTWLQLVDCLQRIDVRYDPALCYRYVLQ